MNNHPAEKSEGKSEINLKAVLAAFEATQKQVQDQGSELGIMRLVTVGLVIVLFIGFAGMFVATTSMLVDSYKTQGGEYQKLTDTLKKTSDKLDKLIGYYE